MAQALTSSVSVTVTGTLTDAKDFATASFPLTLSGAVVLQSGTGANQADRIFSDQRSVNSATTDSLDLAGGGLTDPFGVAFAPARIKAIYVKSASANTTNLTLTRPANGVPFFSASGDSIVIKPGGVVALTDPSATAWAVTAGTGDLVDIVNSAGATATYDIVIIGVSA